MGVERAKSLGEGGGRAKVVLYSRVGSYTAIDIGAFDSSLYNMEQPDHYRHTAILVTSPKAFHPLLELLCAEIQLIIQISILFFFVTVIF